MEKNKKTGIYLLNYWELIFIICFLIICYLFNKEFFNYFITIGLFIRLIGLFIGLLKITSSLDFLNSTFNSQLIVYLLSFGGALLITYLQRKQSLRKFKMEKSISLYHSFYYNIDKLYSSKLRYDYFYQKYFEKRYGFLTAFDYLYALIELNLISNKKISKSEKIKKFPLFENFINDDNLVNAPFNDIFNTKKEKDYLDYLSYEFIRKFEFFINELNLYLDKSNKLNFKVDIENWDKKIPPENITLEKLYYLFELCNELGIYRQIKENFKDIIET